MKKSKKLWKDFLYCDNMIFVYPNEENFSGSDFMKYNFQKEWISEGTQICNITADGFKSACVTVNFVLPLSEKASLFALVPNVLMRSSEKYTDFTEIEKKLALLYGAELVADVSKTGEHHVLRMGVSCIDDRFAFDDESISAECGELLFDLIFKPKLENGVFTSEVVESEKRLLAERLSAEDSDKRTYAKNRCEEIMFSEETYGIHRLGTKAMVNAITPETLYSAYKEMLETAKIVVCVSGNADFEAVKKLATGYLNAINRNAEIGETRFVEYADEVKYIKETEEVKQGKLVMGFRMGMKDSKDNYAARRIMVELFGGIPHSKLFLNVREKMSLCYYCSARMIRAKGIMFVQSGIESYNEEKAKNAIIQQLEDIKNGDFTDGDIEYSVKALEDSFKSVTDSPEALDSWFMSQCVSGDYNYPEDFIDEFKKVTREDIIKAAQSVTLDTVFMLEGTAKGGDSDE